MFHCLKNVFRSANDGYRKDLDVARSGRCVPLDRGYAETRIDGCDPLLFYTETCPEGTYLTGIISDREIMAKGPKNAF